jgi:hypothetical protein
VRIGTWNLAGRWTPEHQDLLLAQDCDVWLLTEVSDRVSLDGWHEVRTTGVMAPRRTWAAIFARQALSDGFEPHPASVAARLGKVVLCSSILPWRGCGSNLPWHGATHAEKTDAALSQLLRGLPDEDLVWGGDWNHSLDGVEYAGSKSGRKVLLDAVRIRGLQVPTERLPHHLGTCLSIDHIAVPMAWKATARHVPVGRLSDHDAYVADVQVS